MADTGEMRQYEHQMRVWEANREVALKHLEAIIGFGTLTINSIILTNGAAAAAVLALLGSVWDKPDARAIVGPIAGNAVAEFGSGALLAMLAAGASYFSQYLYMLHHADHADAENAPKPKLGIGLHLLAILFCVMGIILFGVGLFQGLDALRQVH